MDKPNNQMKLFSAVANIISAARQLVYRTSNYILLNMYWQIGHLIVEEEQGGKQKAVCGKAVLKQLSVQLTLEFGKGFDERNLNNMRAFYHAFPIWNAVRTELSWTHYRMISRIEIQISESNICCTALKAIGIQEPCNAILIPSI